jgi:hypothetical protein
LKTFKNARRLKIWKKMPFGNLYSELFSDLENSKFPNFQISKFF